MQLTQSAPALTGAELEAVAGLFEDDAQGEILAYACTKANACEDE